MAHLQGGDHNTIYLSNCQIHISKHIQTYQIGHIRHMNIYSHTILSPIMSYYLVQIFDKNGEKYLNIVMFFIKIQEKF